MFVFQHYGTTTGHWPGGGQSVWSLTTSLWCAILENSRFRIPLLVAFAMGSNFIVAAGTSDLLGFWTSVTVADAALEPQMARPLP